MPANKIVFFLIEFKLEPDYITKMYEQGFEDGVKNTRQKKTL